MADRILFLDMDENGVTAWTAKEQARVVYADLADIPEEGSMFQAGLDVIAGQLDIKACSDAVVLVSARQVSFRNISLPFRTDKKIRQVLPFELGPGLPLSDESYVSEYLVQDLHFVSDQHLLLTASMPEETVRHIVSCLKAYQIRPRVITPKGFARAVLFLEKNKLKQDLVYICLGRSDITLIVAVKGMPVIVRTLPASGMDAQTIVHAVSQTLTGFKQRAGMDFTFDVFIDKESVGEPSAAGIETALAGHPLLKLSGIQRIDTDMGRTELSALTRSRLLFNFCSGPYGAGSFFHKFRSELAVLAVLGVIAMGVSMFSLYKDIVTLEGRIAAEKAAAIAVFRQTFPDMAGMPGGHPPLLLMQAQVRDALKKRGTATPADELMEPVSVQAVDILFELSRNIPAGMSAELSRLLLGRRHLTIAGATDSFNSVDRIKTALEQSPVFKAVTINSAETGKTADQITFNFRIDI